MCFNAVLYKITKRTPTRPNTNRCGKSDIAPSVKQRKTSGKAASSSVSCINKTLYTLVRIVTELAFVNTPIRDNGDKDLKKQADNKTETGNPKVFNTNPTSKIILLSSTKQKVSDENIPIHQQGHKCLKKQEDKKKTPTTKVRHFNENPKPKLPPLFSSTKRTVFLDLDETLVHSSLGSAPVAYDFIVKPKINGKYMKFYVLKRPGVDKFLAELAEKYEVVVFTAGLKEYASLVLDKLDTEGVISHRLYRDSCTEVDGRYVKDLSSTGRALKRAVLIDDNPNCFMYQPDNAVPIRPFIDDPSDNELEKLGSFLQVSDCYEDMRDAVEDYLFGEM